LNSAARSSGKKIRAPCSSIRRRVPGIVSASQRDHRRLELAQASLDRHRVLVVERGEKALDVARPLLRANKG